VKYASFGGDFRIEHPGHLLRRAGRMGRHLRWPAIGALLATVVAAAARLLGPLVVRHGIDEGIAASDKGMITTAALVFVVLLALQYVAARVSQYAVSWVGERFLLRLRSRVFGHIVGMDMPYFDRAKTGVLVSRMTSDIEAMTEFSNEGAVIALSNVLTAVGVAAAMLFVDWRLALMTLALIVVVVVLSVVFQRHAARAYAKIRERIGGVLATLQEGITGVRVVQAFTQQGAQAGTFGRVNERYFEANMQAAAAISWYFPAVSFLRVVGIGLVLFVGGRRVVAGDLTFGSLVVFLLYLDWFFQPIINLANVYNLLQAALAALGKLFELLDVRPTVAERPGAYDLPGGGVGLLHLEGVTFGYDAASPVIRDVDLQVQPGTRLAIVGETGAGKSTIAKLLLRFYDPGAGRVTIDGHDLRDVTTASRAASIVLIPQDDFLFNGSLRDNFRYGVPDAPDRAIWDVCRAMGIDDWVRSLPDGLDTAVRERGSRFSAGERQLVALGRAFLVDPAVIVLDEATSNLDPETEVRVEGALRVLLAGRSSVVIAHRLRSARRADRVIMVDGGRIVAEGDHEGLIASTPAYRRLVEVWERGLA